MKLNFTDYFFNLLIIITIVLVFYPVLLGGYVWDDYEYIEILQLHLSENALIKAITEPFYISANYYRPVAVFSLYYEAQLVDKAAFLSHLINLILHIINVFLVLRISQNLCSTTFNLNKKHINYVCYLSSLCFAFNPILVEPVTWISGRFDLLVTTFSLLTIYSFFCIKKSAFSLTLLFIVYFLGSASKEMIAALPLAIVIMVLIVNNFFNHQASTPIKALELYKHQFFILVISGLSYLILRYMVLGYLLKYEDSNYPIPYNSAFEHAVLIFKTIGIYINKLFIPFIGLSPINPHPQKLTVLDFDFLLGLGTFCFLFIGLYVTKLRKASLLIGLFIALLLPVLHILPLGSAGQIINERFMTMPVSIVMSLLPLYVLYFSQKISNSNIKILSIFAFIWLVLSITITLSLLPLWKNNITFWSWLIKTTPNSYVVNNNYAVVLLNKGKEKEAITYFLKAYSILPRELDIKIAADLYLKLGQYESAEDSYLQLKTHNLSIKSKDKLNLRLSNIYACQNKYNKAIEHLNDITEHEDYLKESAQLELLIYSRTQDEIKFKKALHSLKRLSPALDELTLLNAFEKKHKIGC